jgi:hypothetical protein
MQITSSATLVISMAALISGCSFSQIDTGEETETVRVGTKAVMATGSTKSIENTLTYPLPQTEDPVYGLLPLRFEPHPTPDGGKIFVSRGTGYAFVWNGDEAAIFLKHEDTIANTDVRMKLLGAASNPPIKGIDRLPGKSHYFLGNEPGKWRTDVPHYARVRATDVYPGIDLVIYGNEQQLEYDFLLGPGVDPAVLTLGFEGVDHMEINEHGDLVLHVPGGELIHRAPYAYQQVDGAEKPVASRYDLRPDGAVGFELLAAYDGDRPLVIDPVLVYSTYLGGEGADDGHDIAIDATGHSYVTGSTGTLDFGHILFPTTVGAFQEMPANACAWIGCREAFVSKLTPAGDDLVYSTFLGGTQIDVGDAITVDAFGNAYITGSTSEISGPNDFPVTPNAIQLTPDGGKDAFLVKLDPSGNLLYSTYLGGSGGDEGQDIAVSDEGEAVLTGRTSSFDFPVTPGALPGATEPDDGFLVRIDTSGNTQGVASLLYATRLGSGSSVTAPPTALVLDDAGNAWVNGSTSSPDFPITPDAYQPILSGIPDLYLTAIDPTGVVLYSTFFGGSGWEIAGGLALDGEGFAYLTGISYSQGLPTPFDFPVTPGAFQTVTLDDNDAFVVKLDTTVPGPDALVYSTLLGGTGFDWPHDIAIDNDGNAYVTGHTEAADFPLQNNFQRCGDIGLADIFVSVLDPSGSSLVFSTTLGTDEAFRDRGEAIVVDSARNLYVTGSVDGKLYRPTFPITDGAFQEEIPSGRPLAFVTKIDVWNVAPGGPDLPLNCSGIDAGLYALGNRSSNGGAPMALYLLDKTNAMRIHGVTTGTVGLRGLAIDESTGKFYSAYGSPLVTGKRGIVEIDPVTGAVTDIGGTKALVALAFDSSGQLYGAENFGAGPGNVYKIDTGTGVETYLGTVTAQDAFGPGLAFDRIGNSMYYKNFLGELSTVDTSLGAETFIGTASFPWFGSHSFDFDEDGNVYYHQHPILGRRLAFAAVTDIFNATNLGSTGLGVWGLSYLSVGDSDGDGVNDDHDICPNSPEAAIINADGCAIADLCPCWKPVDSDKWKNHGEYKSCVAHAANDFLDTGLISGSDHGAIVSGASHSACGVKK